MLPNGRASGTQLKGVFHCICVRCGFSAQRLKMLGSLSALNSLQSAATLRQEDEAETLAQTRTAQKQKQKLLELQERRDNLLEQLQGAVSTSGVPGGEGVGDDGSHETIESSELRSAVAYMAELKEKLNVYKLTGASIIKSNQDGKVVCFTTSYKGSYLESYHLKLQGLSTGQFKVSHHDLPPFVFTSCVPDSLEVKDIPSVVQPVREVLSMYVLRREELKSAEGKFSDTLHVAERSGPIDFVCFHMDVRPSLQVEITLKYKDLKHYLPSAVNAVPLKRGAARPTEGLPEEVKDKLTQVFCGNRLCAAVAMAMEILRDHFSPARDQP